MPDDTDQVDVRPPPSPAIPAGSGYTYSTQGAADWRAPVTAPGPGGVSVPLPANVQGFAAVQGAPGPSPQVQQDAAMQDWMNTVFRKLPIQEAFAAIEAANKFQGQRIYQNMLNQGKSSGEALAAAGPLLFGGGSSQHLTGLANYIKALRPPPSATPTRFGEPGQGGWFIPGTQKMIGDKPPPKPPTPPKPGSMTQMEMKEVDMLKDEYDKAMARFKDTPAPSDQEKAQLRESLGKIIKRRRELIGRPLSPADYPRAPLKATDRLPGQSYYVPPGGPKNPKGGVYLWTGKQWKLEEPVDAGDIAE